MFANYHAGMLSYAPNKRTVYICTLNVNCIVYKQHIVLKGAASNTLPSESFRVTAFFPYKIRFFGLNFNIILLYRSK